MSRAKFIFNRETGFNQIRIGDEDESIVEFDVDRISLNSGSILDLNGATIPYVPEDPANWSTVPTNLVEAVDYLAAGSGSGGGGGGGTPGGSNGDIQYKVNAGTFGGTSKIRFVSGDIFVTGSFLGDLAGTASYAVTASNLQNALNLASVLTYQAGISPNTATTFGDWDDLWDAYLNITGATDIYVVGGFVLESLTPVTYSFRQDTKLRGLFGAYGGNSFINLRENVCFENLYNFENIQLTSETNLAPVLAYNSPTYTYPSIILDRTTLYCSGAAPMISWSQDNTLGQLSIDLYNVSKLTSSIGPVFYNSGALPSPNQSQINLFVGQGCEIGANTMASNVNSNINIQARDITANINFLTQSNLDGTLNNSSFPIPENDTPFSVNAGSGIFLSIESLNASSLIQNFIPQNPYGIPAYVSQPKFVSTTDATPLIALSSSVPPILSAFLNIEIIARESTIPGVSSDTYVANYKGLFACDAIIGLQYGSLGLSSSFEDRTAGAATWTISSSINTPNPGDFNLYVIGEAGKNINWTIINNSTLGIGI